MGKEYFRTQTAVSLRASTTWANAKDLAYTPFQTATSTRACGRVARKVDKSVFPRSMVKSSRVTLPTTALLQESLQSWMETGELTELDGNMYCVAYDGILKFSTGALPHSKGLIRSAPCHTNGDGEQGDADGGELDAPKPAALPPLPAGSVGKEEPVSAPEWDPFASVAVSVPPPAAVAPAHMRSGRDGAAEDWDPFANSSSPPPPKCAAMESAVELTLPYELHKSRNHATISAPRFSPEKVASWPDRASTNEALALEQVERQICHELVPHKQRQ